MSILRHADGDELAVTVDVLLDADHLQIKCDLCLEGGIIVDELPDLQVHHQALVDKSIVEAWAARLSQFLAANKERIVALAHSLR